MLFAGLGSVHFVKNRGLGLENSARGLGQHFQDLGHRFSVCRPTLSRQITCMYLAELKQAYDKAEWL